MTTTAEPLITRLKKSDRERARWRDENLTRGSIALHARQDAVTGDELRSFVDTCSTTADHVVSRLRRLDDRAAFAAIVAELPTLIDEQQADDAEQQQRAAEFERLTAVYNTRKAERAKRISRARNRRGEMQRTARYASWEWHVAERSIAGELSRLRNAPTTIALTDDEAEYVRWNQANRNWTTHQGVDAARAAEVLAGVRDRQDALEVEKAAARERITVLEQRLAELAEIALVPFPPADAIEKIMAGEEFDGAAFDDDLGDDDLGDA